MNEDFLPDANTNSNSSWADFLNTIGNVTVGIIHATKSPAGETNTAGGFGDANAGFMNNDVFASQTNSVVGLVLIALLLLYVVKS